MTDRHEASDDEAALSPIGASDTVAFDVLVRSAVDDDMPASLQTIEKLRPPQEWIERCARWFSAQGMICHRTDFGLACEATPSRFAAIFGEGVLERNQEGHWLLTQEVKAPEPIRNLVDQVTLSRPPELF